MIRGLDMVLLKFILNDSFLAPRLGEVFVVCRPSSVVFVLALSEDGG